MSLLTEAEALLNWCPQARQTAEGFSTYNRDCEGKREDNCRCLGSGCMAWRWSSKEIEKKVLRYKESDPEMMQFCKGYCGLAGNPGSN